MYDMYQEIILQHYRSPRNFGPLANAERKGAESNPLCGDHIEMQLRFSADRARVEAVQFTGDGCAISVASASMLTEKVKGMPVAEAGALTQEDILKLVGIPLSPVRIKCALTGFVALGRALTSSGEAPGSPPTSSPTGSASEAT